MLFTGIWAMVKGWLDEKTVKKVQIHGSGYRAKLLEYIDDEQIPDFLGGKNTAKLVDNAGPWDDFELVDGAKPGDVVGIKKKGEAGPPIFTPQDLERLPNPKLSEDAQAKMIAHWEKMGDEKEEEKKSGE